MNNNSYSQHPFLRYNEKVEGVSKVSFNKKVVRWLRSVQMQGTEIEGEGAYMKYVTEPEYRSNAAVGHL